MVGIWAFSGLGSLKKTRLGTMFPKISSGAEINPPQWAQETIYPEKIHPMEKGVIKEKEQTPVEHYTEGLIPDRDPLIREIGILTGQHGRPFLGPQGGMTLATLAYMNKVKRVYEWTGAYGYSTLWLAKILPNDCQYMIGTIADENQRLIANYLKRAGLQSRVSIKITDGAKQFGETEGQFDLLVLDLQQERTKMAAWLDVIPDKIAEGGLVVSLGNLPAGVGSEQTKNMLTSSVEAYNHRMFADPRFLSSMLPICDGTMVSYRIPRG
ncbi:O-methyltransferase [Leptospirillum ferrooxidans]|uniref:Putative o-methyltransferase family protein n=1 Tax=Leptospirillum ferrooxidans (strain C2-3) TaxID=1162668 RepID=I0IRJ4_LEPFC|nr:class I SAM-dependent methyltransferase [Leptospirillum ferrooxidans]BAM07893.1 putative o-methyltransferase family protein [Leptospirillum ferrooxidans C2-3]